MQVTGRRGDVEVRNQSTGIDTQLMSSGVQSSVSAACLFIADESLCRLTSLLAHPRVREVWAFSRLRIHGQLRFHRVISLI